MNPTQKRAKEFRAHAATLTPLQRDLYLSSALVRRTLDQADDEQAELAEVRAARSELRRARKAGPEIARVIELRRAGRHAEATLYEQANAIALRGQRATLAATADPAPETDPGLSLTPDFQPPEPPQAA